VAVLGAAAGLCLVGVWNGTTPLIVVAGLALYLAALDATEPLAQEVDHPDRSASFDLKAGEVHLRQLAAPAVLMVLVGAVGILAATAVTAGSATTWQLGAVMVLPAIGCALGAGAMSVVKGPPPALTSSAMLIPEAAGARAVGRLLWPPILSVIGLIPIIAARNASQHHLSVLVAAGSVEQLVAVVALLAVAWVRYQEDAHHWWESQVSEAKHASGRA
jgi:hypothetical protein